MKNLAHFSVCFRIFLFVASCAAFLFLVLPGVSSAHEVYVLSPEEVQSITKTDSPNPFSIIPDEFPSFIFWTAVVVFTIAIVFFISISRRLERLLDPILFEIKKPYGILIGRATLGLALLSAGWYDALFGPELPLDQLFGAAGVYIQWALIITGIAILFGFFTRLTTLITMLIFAAAVVIKQEYMLTYINYLGEMIVVGVLGQHVLSVDKNLLHRHGIIERFARFIEKYAFLILRVTFGVSLIFASVYAKFIHSELALRTATEYNLTAYLPGDTPMFLVLGAFIIEAMLGLFFIIGFEVRFASILLTIFLSLSLVYFGEAVWPHIILLGVAAALFVHGYDRYTLEGRFFKDATHEPVL